MVESYEEMLQKAYAGIDEPTDTGERFQVPKTRVYLEGKTTVLENFGDIVDTLNREPDHFMKYVLGELGTAGKIDGPRAVFNGKFELSQFEAILKGYVADYVICTECGRPRHRHGRADGTACGFYVRDRDQYRLELLDCKTGGTAYDRCGRRRHRFRRLEHLSARDQG